MSPTRPSAADDDTAACAMAQDLRPEPEMRPPPFPCSALTVLDGPGIAAELFHPVIQSAQGDHGVRGASVPPESSQSPVTPSRTACTGTPLRLLTVCPAPRPYASTLGQSPAPLSAPRALSQSEWLLSPSRSPGFLIGSRQGVSTCACKSVCSPAAVCGVTPCKHSHGSHDA